MVWNGSLDVDRQRELVPRDYIYASELGKSFYDRYWAMHGRNATNPPNTRAQRKFEAGNLTEWVVLQILKRSKVLQDTQVVIENADGDMRVRGRCDFIAGGKIDKDVDFSDLPESFAVISEVALEDLRKKYPDGLAEQGLELKSCSGTMFNVYEQAPALHHGLQSFHYAYGLNKPYHLSYISRDDLRMVEYVILPDSERWKKLYYEDIATMAEIYRVSESEIADYKEPLLTYDPDTNKFKKNWKVEYSNYLDDYGFERSDIYGDEASKLARRINGVVKHIKNQKKLSKVNYKALDDTYAFYPGAEEKIKELLEKYPQPKEFK
jgi:hypothetical protein